MISVEVFYIHDRSPFFTGAISTYSVCCQNWGHYDRGHLDRWHLDLDSSNLFQKGRVSLKPYLSSKIHLNCLNYQCKEIYQRINTQSYYKIVISIICYFLFVLCIHNFVAVYLFRINIAPLSTYHLILLQFLTNIYHICCICLFGYTVIAFCKYYLLYLITPFSFNK